MSATSTVAALAGLPVDTSDLLAWVTGRSPPPRHSEGLNDPMSVAALAHFVLLAQEAEGDAVAKATLNALRLLLDDREEARIWGRDDLVLFGSAFRAAKRRLAEPYPAPTLLAVAERLLEVHAELEIAPVGGRSLATLDGRQLIVDPRTFGTIWLLACHLPAALLAAGFTSQIIPSFVCLPKLLGLTARDLAGDLEKRLGDAALAGLKELDAVERLDANLPKELGVTRRSKLPALMRLEAAYPGIRIPAIARLLKISPQGAAKLASQAREMRGHPY
ncbi:hypothetical protein HP438_05580 [Sphingomonas zeae]|uniref:HTH DNA binding domain-containing protein n=1 Tax=Sphingomonas zeae TaxID=1646122 RepID=A0A7Y6B4U5_9SPHN|nr:hypothetical protein [Sphingomonas zeae]